MEKNKILLILGLIFSSCGSVQVIGTYNGIDPKELSDGTFFTTTLAVKEDSSYFYTVENDVTLLVKNEGTWKLHDSKIAFKESRIKTVNPAEARVIGITTTTIDSLMNLKKRALSFYMVVKDTSWIIGALIITPFGTFQTGIDNRPLLLEDDNSEIEFEYLGQKLDLKMPEDKNLNQVTYYIDFSHLGNYEVLEKLPFDELRFKKGKLLKEGKIVFERVSGG